MTGFDRLSDAELREQYEEVHDLMAVDLERGHLDGYREMQQEAEWMEQEANKRGLDL